jgi:hypothetical protein
MEQVKNGSDKCAEMVPCSFYDRVQSTAAAAELLHAWESLSSNSVLQYFTNKLRRIFSYKNGINVL